MNPYTTKSKIKNQKSKIYNTSRLEKIVCEEPQEF